MSEGMQMLIVIGADYHGTDCSKTVPFMNHLDIDNVKETVKYFEKRYCCTSFAFVRGVDMTIDRFVSMEEAIAFADNELIKELPTRS